MSFCSECCVLPGRGLCDELITRPEESYPLWCVVVCDLGHQVCGSHGLKNEEFDNTGASPTPDVVPAFFP